MHAIIGTSYNLETGDTTKVPMGLAKLVGTVHGAVQQGSVWNATMTAFDIQDVDCVGGDGRGDQRATAAVAAARKRKLDAQHEHDEDGGAPYRRFSHDIIGKQKWANLEIRCQLHELMLAYATLMKSEAIVTNAILTVSDLLRRHSDFPRFIEEQRHTRAREIFEEELTKLKDREYGPNVWRLSDFQPSGDQRSGEELAAIAREKVSDYLAEKYAEIERQMDENPDLVSEMVAQTDRWVPNTIAFATMSREGNHMTGGSAICQVSVELFPDTARRRVAPGARHSGLAVPARL
jgi:hypothetical protein